MVANLKCFFFFSQWNETMDFLSSNHSKCSQQHGRHSSVLMLHACIHTHIGNYAIRFNGLAYSFQRITWYWLLNVDGGCCCCYSSCWYSIKIARFLNDARRRSTKYKPMHRTQWWTQQGGGLLYWTIWLNSSKLNRSGFFWVVFFYLSIVTICRWSSFVTL